MSRLERFVDEEESLPLPPKRNSPKIERKVEKSKLLEDAALDSGDLLSTSQVGPAPPSLRLNSTYKLSTPLPGAYSVPGATDRLKYVPGDTNSQYLFTAEDTLVNAHLVDALDTPRSHHQQHAIGPLVDASPMDNSYKPESPQKPLEILLRDRRIQYFVCISLACFVGLVAAVSSLVSGNSTTNDTALPPPATTLVPVPTQPPINDPTTTQSDNKQLEEEFLSELSMLVSHNFGESLQDVDSPQRQALRWVVDGADFASFDIHQRIQRFAMATLFFATDGTHWKSKEGWMTESNECTWYQHERQNGCDGDGNLIMLYLPANLMVGSLPDEIGLLSSLVTLDLTNNALVGRIPEPIGNLLDLNVVKLASNSLTGEIPSRLYSLSLLETIDLGGNELTGDLSNTDWSAWADLRELHLSWNINLAGQIPTSVGSLSSLSFLNFGGTKIGGTLPASLFEIQSLGYLGASSAGLTGTIPSTVGLASRLIHLRLADNGLSGEIPTELGLMENLSFLHLSENDLSGAIPTQLGLALGLDEIHLDSNNFDGSIPTELGMLTDLRSLKIEDNLYQGIGMPTEVCVLTETHFLQPSALTIDCTLVTCFCCANESGDICCDSACQEEVEKGGQPFAPSSAPNAADGGVQSPEGENDGDVDIFDRS